MDTEKILDTEKIIETAAQNAGMPLPLDDKTREFSEGLLRSFQWGLDLAHGRVKPSGESFWDKLSQWEAEA